MPYNIYQSVRYIGLSSSYIKKVVEITLKYLKKRNIEFSIHFIGDRRMRSINRDYRDIDSTTDVIAFAMQEGREFDKTDFGDIFISPEKVKRQAKQQSISYKEELTRVLIHGILHLNGYDHVTQKEEKVMFGIQEKLIKKVIKRKS